MYYINKQNTKKTYKYSDKKTNIISIAGIIVLATLLWMSVALNDICQRNLNVTMYQPQIATEVLRFHVIANSDSEEDQQLKLKVKETVLEMVRPMLEGAESKEEAEEILQRNMEIIEVTADKVIQEEGYSYKSKGVLGKTTFPLKQYGDLLFPAGEYEAFRILLGEAKGRNWWCVMFPTLCYVDEAYDVITEENKEKFREVLTEEEYNSLLVTMELVDMEENAEDLSQKKGDTKVFYKMKSLLWLNKMIDYFQK